jgi:hypothetical protein
MKYYIILLHNGIVKDILSFDDETSRDCKVKSIEGKMPYTDILGGFTVNEVQTLNQVI